MKSVAGLISPFRNEYSADEGHDFLYMLAYVGLASFKQHSRSVVS
jgi:hypothetical protein